MHVEFFFAETDHLVKPRFVSANRRGIGGGGELGLQGGPDAAEAAVEQGRRQAIKREAAAALFYHQAGFFQQLQMARHARLRQPQHRGELGDVQPAVLSGQHPEQAQPGLVAQQPKQVAGLTHIHECI